MESKEIELKLVSKLIEIYKKVGHNTQNALEISSEDVSDISSEVYTAIQQLLTEAYNQAIEDCKAKQDKVGYLLPEDFLSLLKK